MNETFNSFQRSSPEVKGAIFDLLHLLLTRRHRYFFPSPVLAQMLTDGPMTNKGGTIAHKAQFLAIMTVSLVFRFCAIRLRVDSMFGNFSS